MGYGGDRSDSAVEGGGLVVVGGNDEAEDSVVDAGRSDAGVGGVAAADGDP